MLNKEEKEILSHTSERAANKMFCGSSKAMDSLVEKGYMQCLGKITFVPDMYYMITKEGEKALAKENHES